MTGGKTRRIGIRQMSINIIEQKEFGKLNTILREWGALTRQKKQIDIIQMKTQFRAGEIARRIYLEHFIKEVCLEWYGDEWMDIIEEAAKRCTTDKLNGGRLGPEDVLWVVDERIKLMEKGASVAKGGELVRAVTRKGAVSADSVSSPPVKTENPHEEQGEWKG